MNLKTRWLTIAGAVITTGALCTGVALAAGNAPAAPMSNRLQAAVQAGKLTQGQADVQLQLRNLRQAARQKLQSDSKALVDQAVQSGKITQEQGNQLLQPRGRFGRRGGKGANGFHGKGGKLTQDQLKAKLDAAVKAGKITQDQENQMLQRWANRQPRGQ